MILPAILIGDVSDEQLERLTAQDDRIVGVSQQARGMSVSYPCAVGTLLRLAANLDRGIRPLGDLVRGLKAMAEDPDTKLLRQFPALRELVLTSGQPYTADELRGLGTYLRSFIDLPPLASGIEAFVRFAPGHPLPRLAGWHALSCRSDDGRTRFDSRDIEALTRHDRRTFDGGLLRQIVALGQQVGRSGPPGMFLLWENSD